MRCVASVFSIFFFLQRLKIRASYLLNLVLILFFIVAFVDKFPGMAGESEMFAPKQISQKVEDGEFYAQAVARVALPNEAEFLSRC